MRLLGEIFRPSRNQVTWGWGKLAMRGARMTAASPWDTLCCVSLSSKLPMSAKCAGEPCQGPGRGWQRVWGRSRVRSRVRLGSRLEATGMGSPRGCRGAALGSALCSPPRLGHGMVVGTRSYQDPSLWYPELHSPIARTPNWGLLPMCPPLRMGRSHSEEGSAPGLPGIAPCPNPRFSAGSIPARPWLRNPLPPLLPDWERTAVEESRVKTGARRRGGVGDFLLTSLNCCN